MQTKVLPSRPDHDKIGIVPIIMKKSREKQKSESLYRRSRQRERILALLRSTDVHPTANWIYSRMRKEFPDLSMGTVYRNIGILLQQGLINKIAFGSTFDRFDAHTTPHYHFICEKCDVVIDLDMPVDDTLNARVPESAHHEVRRHEIEFFGVCAQCGGKT
jgi:Fur family peroxide stress response transcriptional regulator